MFPWVCFVTGNVSIRSLGCVKISLYSLCFDDLLSRALNFTAKLLHSYVRFHEESFVLDEIVSEMSRHSNLTCLLSSRHSLR